MQVHLVDGTYELFRHYYGVPQHQTSAGEEVGAVRGVLHSMLALLGDGATHVAVATDHVIESFRNELWPGYKDGSDLEPAILAQFGLLETSLDALGLAVWPMTRYEADDGLAAGVRLAAADPAVERVYICTPDKDLAQCVRDPNVVQLDRRKRQILDEAGVREKFGVGPASIPDYLALVGDSSDGFPGVTGWGTKSASAVLARYEHIEAIPASAEDWDVQVRGAARLARTLVEERERAVLFKQLATLDPTAPVSDDVEDLVWVGPRPTFPSIVARLDGGALLRRAEELAIGRF